MFKKLFFLSLCLTLPLLGERRAVAQNENTQIGRYQMVVVSTDLDGSHKLYLLDTTTGCVWKSALKKNWYEHDAWEPQIVTPPDNS